jgi:biopolymer transport protein ExbD
MKPTASVRVALTAEGEASLNGQSMDRRVLLAQLREMAKLDPDLRVTLAADGRVSWNGVSEILDDIRSAGLTRVGAEVQSKEKIR